MKITTLEVKGYRSLANVLIQFADLSAFIGPNGSGKSSILGSLRLFFDPSLSVDDLDFWCDSSGEAADSISITVTFSDLHDGESKALAHLLDSQQQVVIEKRFEASGQGAYLASIAAVPEFATIRNSVRGHRDQYNQLVDSGEFEGLQRVANKQKAFAAMEAWERENPDRCTSMEQEIDPSILFQCITMLSVEAFESPAQHLQAEGKGAVARLLNRAVDSSAVADRLETVADEAARKSDEILKETKGQLDSFADSLGGILQQFAPGCSINVAWQETTVAGARPRLKVDIETEEGFMRPLEYQGHGVQRSLMYAALTAEVELDFQSEGTVLLVIEEPEAFQHPLSCRVLARTLRVLSGRNYQIAYSTHSPEFVHANLVDGLRIVRRDNRTGGGAATYVESLTGERILHEWERVFDGANFTVESVLGRLSSHLTPQVLEGLFARSCIVVEGDEDEAVVRAASVQRGIELDATGVAIIRANGKSAIPNVLTFLALAGVECYPIFDLDRSKPEGKQHRSAELQILRSLYVGGSAEAGVHPSYACWHDDFGKAIATELSPRYDELLAEASHKFGYPEPSRGKKVAVVVRDMLDRAESEGLRSDSLEALKDKVQELAWGESQGRIRKG